MTRDPLLLSLAGQVAADTGLDGLAAYAIVVDVFENGTDSPYARLVAPSAAIWLAAMVEPFVEALRPILDVVAKLTVAVARGARASAAQDDLYKRAADVQGGAFSRIVSDCSGFRSGHNARGAQIAAAVMAQMVRTHRGWV